MTLGQEKGRRQVKGEKQRQRETFLLSVHFPSVVLSYFFPLADVLPLPLLSPASEVGQV